jgi:hypothetical protein
MAKSVMPDTDSAENSVDDEVEGAIDSVLPAVLQLRPGNHEYGRTGFQQLRSADQASRMRPWPFVRRRVSTGVAGAVNETQNPDIGGTLVVFIFPGAKRRLQESASFEPKMQKKYSP